MGASGTTLTVRGELRGCPVSMNGYQFYAYFVVADQGDVNIILGMDFLKAYDAVINLKADPVSFRPETVINAVQATKTCPDGTRVRLRQVCVAEAGHHAQVEDVRSRVTSCLNPQSP